MNKITLNYAKQAIVKYSNIENRVKLYTKYSKEYLFTKVKNQKSAEKIIL